MTTEKNDKSGISTSQIFDLANLVQYNDGSVVSRTIIKNDAGTITLFAFDKDQDLSEHTAPFDALVQMIDGQAEFVIAGESFELTAGQMILMPANIPHAVLAKTKFKMLLTMLRKK